MRRIAEICCGNVEDAVVAEKAGADRIEFNQAMYLGGLTPSIGSLKLALEKVTIPIVSMVRPRAGGFHYTDAEFAVILREVEEICTLPIEGVVFGCLDAEKRIDVEKNQQIINLLNKYGKDAIFHRAFDCVEDPYEAMETLIHLGVKRVLTSGLKPKASDGAELLADLQNQFGDKIDILAGSGVTASNVQGLIEQTGLTQFHSSCNGWKEDPTTIGQVSFAYAESPHESEYDVVDYQKAMAFVEAVKQT